jgi:D-3-phosphoglycerate dehydrogenase
MAKPLKILIGPSSFAATDHRPWERLESAGFQVVDNPFKRKLTKEELLALLQPEVVGLIAGLEPLDREVLSHSSLKVLSRVGAGMSNVDQAAAKELGIAVRSTPDGPTESVAELTLGMMLSLLRQVPQMDCSLHAGQWVKRTGSELAGKVVALIGFGRIGRRVAELLAPFRTPVLVVDPFLAGELPPGCRRATLAEALAEAQIISLHASGEECLLGSDQFELMRPGVHLCNAARGGLISEEALVRNLASGKVAGAWLDTFGNEPYQGPLTTLANVILTPHVGSYTAECRLAMETEAVENLLGVLAGT